MISDNYYSKREFIKNCDKLKKEFLSYKPYSNFKQYFIFKPVFVKNRVFTNKNTFGMQGIYRPQLHCIMKDRGTINSARSVNKA